MSVIRFLFFTIRLFRRSGWLCYRRTYGGCHTALSAAVDCRSVGLKMSVFWPLSKVEAALGAPRP
jgi:hypothetical protein